MKCGTEAVLLGLVNTVRSHKGLPALVVLTPDNRLYEDLGFDSLDLAELTVRIEERYGVDVFAEGVVRQWGEIEARVVRHAALGTSS